jgi:anti-sigma factor RsiW
MDKHEHCKDLVENISNYVDGSLSEKLCFELEKHLEDCENCRVVVNTLKKTIEIYQNEGVKEKTPNDVKERLFYRLNLEDFHK